MKAITYYRVSTVKQGASGLGLSAQREAVARHLGDEANIIAEYREVESGRKDDRPELRRALDHCKRSGAALVIARLDRLARSARFLLEILDSGVDVRFCDMPQVSGASGRFMLASMANVAELEAGLISERTRAALKAARARGVKLGGPNGAKPLVDYVREHGNTAALAGKSRAADARAESWRGTIETMLADGMGNCEIARTLNAKGETTVKGERWTATSVRRLRQRLGLNETTETTRAAPAQRTSAAKAA